MTTSDPDDLTSLMSDDDDGLSDDKGLDTWTVTRDSRSVSGMVRLRWYPVGRWTVDGDGRSVVGVGWMVGGWFRSMVGMVGSGGRCPRSAVDGCDW